MTAAESAGRATRRRRRRGRDHAARQVETRRRAAAVGVFGLVFGAQTLPVALGAVVRRSSSGAGAALIGRALRRVMAALAVASIAKVAVRGAALDVRRALRGRARGWPFARRGSRGDRQGQPLAVLPLHGRDDGGRRSPFRCRLATVYTLVVPVVYGVIRAAARRRRRAVPSLGRPRRGVRDHPRRRGAHHRHDAAAGAPSRRRGAGGRARSATTIAVRQHATEVERVQVDAIVHDSVLTTLLSAAGAGTPEEQALAARMARRRDRPPRRGRAPKAREDRHGRPARARPSGCARRSTTFSAPFTVRVGDAGARRLPVEAVATRSTPRPCRRW